MDTTKPELVIVIKKKVKNMLMVDIA